MSDMRRKLRQAHGKSAAKKAESAQEQREGGIGMPDSVRAALRQRHERHQRQLFDRQRTVELPPEVASRITKDRFYLRRLEYDFDHRHGDLPLGDALNSDASRLVELARDESLVDFDPRRCLFLDTETTGLSGGAGNVVFMVGLGFFEADRFVLEQTFLRSYGEEPRSLAHVSKRLAERPTLVTFVGKSFDRHRLSTRMSIHKVKGSRRILQARHLDLYHIARRVFGAQLPDARLQTMERAILGVEREDDLPGAEAPLAFLDWMRDRSGAVDRVFEHNRLDVLSLVTMLAVLGER